MKARGWVLTAAMGTLLWSFWSFSAWAQPSERPSTPQAGDPVAQLAPGGAMGEDLFALDPAQDDPGPAAGPRGGRWMGPGRGGQGMHGGPMMGQQRAQLLRELKLTDSQREKLRDLRERQMRKGIQARADLALARLDLGKLLRADRPSLASVDAQIDRIARMRADLAKSRVATLLEMRAVLTPEQLKVLRDRHGMMGFERMRGDGRGAGPEGESE